MKYRLSILISVTFFFIVNSSYGQSKVCDKLYNFPDTEASFKENGTDLLRFFNENILELIYDSNSEVLPPTSFKMIIIINDKDEVESIEAIKGDYSEELKDEILKKLQQENGWNSGKVNGQKVCAKFYFFISCILGK